MLARLRASKVLSLLCNFITGYFSVCENNNRVFYFYFYAKIKNCLYNNNKDDKKLPQTLLWILYVYSTTITFKIDARDGATSVKEARVRAHLYIWQRPFESFYSYTRIERRLWLKQNANFNETRTREFFSTYAQNAHLQVTGTRAREEFQSPKRKIYVWARNSVHIYYIQGFIACRKIKRARGSAGGKIPKWYARTSVYENKYIHENI